MNKIGDFVMVEADRVKGVETPSFFISIKCNFYFFALHPNNGHLLERALENPNTDVPKR